MGRLYCNPLAVRIWHWINAICMVLLIVSGIQLRFDNYVSWMSTARAISFHNIVAFIFLLNYLFWLLFYIFSKKIRLYFPSRDELFRGIFQQARYYMIGIFKGSPEPFHPVRDNKFNPLQKIIYFIIMFELLPTQIVTGILMLGEAEESIKVADNLRIVDGIHVFVSFLLFCFIIVHFYLGFLGDRPLDNLKAMVTGYKQEPED